MPIIFLAAHMNKAKKPFGIVFFVTILFSASMLFGCIGVGDNVSVDHPPTPVRELFVVNSGGGSVSVFDASLSGDIDPLRTFGNLTGLSAPKGIAVDVTNNEFFVANSLNYTITVYSRTASGNMAPLRIISGPSTALNEPVSVAVDTLNNEIFVGN